MIFLKSPGGSGTRFLYSVFGKKNLCGGRDWFNPHQRICEHLPEESKVFYVMAHPLNILLSFEKEGFFNDPHYAMIKNIQGDMNSFANGKIKSVYDYAERGINCFNFKDHFEQNLKMFPNMQLLIYENLATEIELIDLQMIEPKPFVMRRSDYTKENPEFIRKLREIHKEDIDFYHSLTRLT